MKLRSKLSIVSLLVWVLTVVAHAEPVSQLHATGYINDFAHALDQNAVAQMESVCLQVDQKAHAQIAVVTINSLDGADVESYAVDLFKSWGIGDKSTNRGVLILYAIKDHRSRIEVGYGLEPILPDGKVGSFQREAIPLMRERKLQRGAAAGHQPGSGRDRARCRNSDPQCAAPQRHPGTGSCRRPAHFARRDHCIPVILVIVLCYSSARYVVLASAFSVFRWPLGRRWVGGGSGAAVLEVLAAVVRVAAGQAAVGSQRGRDDS